MIATTFDGLDVFLLPYEPAWPGDGTGIAVTFQKITAASSGLSQREEREELAASLRISALKYKAVLSADQADELRAQTAPGVWDNRPVLCPLWGVESAIGEEAAASVQGALRVWYEPDWSAWEIGTGVAPGGFAPSADCLTAPLVWGRFDSMPSPVIIDGHDDELATFSLVEKGPIDYQLTPKTGTLVAGTSVNGQTVPLLQTEHGFGWGSNSETVDVRIEQERLGYGRGEVEQFTPQQARRRQKVEFDWLEQDDIAYLLRLFNDRGGNVSPLWAIAAHSLSERVYGRFFTNKITIEWELPARSGERATCKLEFVALPTEQTIPSGETFGETIGPMGKRWFGYVITDGVLTWRATSYESPIVGPGGTFTPRNIDHGKIEDELNLAANSCTLTVEHWSGGPFGRLFLNPRSLTLTVTIYEGLLSAPTAAEAIFTGTANKPESFGSKLTIELEGLGSIAAIEGPRCVLAKDCCATYGDTRCQKDLAPLRVTADLLSFAAGVAKIDATAADYPLNHFAEGYVDRPVDGFAYRYLISASYDFGDGKLALALEGDIAPEITGAEVDWILTPGCPGTWEACQARENTVNFRGEPYLPDDNPTIPALTQTAQGGKK